MHKIYIGDNQEIDISEVSHIDTSHTLESDTIIIDFKDYTNKELHYEVRYERDHDLQTLQNAYNEFNGLKSIRGGNITMSKLPAPIKEELSKVSQAIALSMLIDLIMMNYNPKGHREERTEAINKIKLRVKKYINKKAKSNKRDFQRSLSVVKEIWNETLDHYDKEDLVIEGVATVIRFHTFYAEILSKNVGLTDKLIEKFSFGISQSSTLEIEQNSYKMADMILNKLSVYTGVKPLSFKERLEKYRKEKETNE